MSEYQTFTRRRMLNVMAASTLGGVAANAAVTDQGGRRVIRTEHRQAPKLIHAKPP